MSDNYTFRGQREDEDVLQVIKQNVWVFAKTGLMILLMANLAVFAFIMFGASGFFSYILVIFVVVVGFVIGYRWYVWANGVSILTNQRVLKMDQIGLFYRSISEIELNQIKDVAMEVKGPIATFMNFGVIRIKTDADTAIELRAVTDPYDIQQMIIKTANLMKNDLGGKLEMRDNFGEETSQSLKKF